MSSVVVYIGAGLDVRPIKVLQNVKKFIYIDSLPSTQQPTLDKKNQQYSKTFIIDFCRKMEGLGLGFDWNLPPQITNTCFASKITSPLKISFENKMGICVDYYMNTPFSSNISEELRKELSHADTLVIAGFFPDECILEMMNTPVHIICWQGTYYDDDDDDDDDYKKSVVRKIHQDTTNVANITYYEKRYISKEFSSLKEVELYRCRDKRDD